MSYAIHFLCGWVCVCVCVCVHASLSVFLMSIWFSVLAERQGAHKGCLSDHVCLVTQQRCCLCVTSQSRVCDSLRQKPVSKLCIKYAPRVPQLLSQLPPSPNHSNSCSTKTPNIRYVYTGAFLCITCDVARTHAGLRSHQSSRFC